MRRLAPILALLLCLCHPVPLGVDHIVSVTRMVEPSREAAPERVVEMTVTAYASTDADCGSMMALRPRGARQGRAQWQRIGRCSRPVPDWRYRVTDGV
jgi:hypothetical protein